MSGLADELRMEALSRAYVMAVAAQAGFTLSTSEHDVDSCDGTIQGVGGRRVKLDFQLKAHTFNGDCHSGFAFDLKMKNYNDLRNVDVLTPQLLFVVVMPSDPTARCMLTADGLLLRRCGFWLSLRGLPPVANVTTERVQVPGENVLDAFALSALVQRVAEGEGA